MCKKRAVIYARTNRGGFEGERQLYSRIQICKRYIESKEDFILVDTYTERGLSAIGTKQAKGFECMMRDAEHRAFDFVIISSMDVLSRNTIYIIKTTKKLLELGIETYFVQEKMLMSKSKGGI